MSDSLDQYMERQTVNPNDSASARQFAKYVEEKYSVRYVGFYELYDENCLVFYNPNPDFDKGHSHYMGVWIRLDGKVYLFDARSITEARYPAYSAGGETIVSRYRRDYVAHFDGTFIDGGPNWRSNKQPNGFLTVRDGVEVITIDLA